MAAPAVAVERMIPKKHSNLRTAKFLYLRYWRFSSRRIGSLQDWKIQLIFWCGALLVGVVVELFARASNWFTDQFDTLYWKSHYWPFLITPMGFVLIAWLMNRFSPAAQGSGIPQVLLVLKQRYNWLRPSFLSLQVAFFKILLTCIGLFSGASIGREGPSVHVGAALMHRIGLKGGLHKRYVDNSLIVAGGAAGVAAAFNAPMAGIVFAIEELAQSFEQRTSGTLIMAIILSGVVVLMLSGHYSYFGHTEGSLPISSSWPAVLLIGAVCGIGGGLFGRLLILGTRGMAPYLRRHPIWIAAACGISIATIGFFTHGETFGSGYAQATALMSGQTAADWTFPITKLVATLVSYYSGIPGGLFSPSLATGAGLGALIAKAFPAISLGALTVVGMASYLSAVIQRPITSFAIVMELTGNNHELLLPLMVGAFLAHGISRLVQPDPLYDALAHGLAEGRVHPMESEAGKDSSSGQQTRSPMP